MPDLPIETRVEAIRRLLQIKHRVPFTTRVALGGYADEPEYSLEVKSVYRSFSDPFVMISGVALPSPIGIYEKWYKKYWEDMSKVPDPGDQYAIERHRGRSVAGSEEEFLLKLEVGMPDDIFEQKEAAK